MASVFNHIVCPNCGAVWTIEEIEDQICDACGYPDQDSTDDADYEPDGDGPRGKEADYAERERMDYYQRYLK